MIEELINVLSEKFMLEGLSLIAVKIIAGIAESIITLLIAVILVRIVKYATNKFVKLSINSAPASERKLNTIRFIVYSVLKYVIYFLAIGNILDKIGIPIETILAVAGIGSVAIGFGSQSLVKDIITGLFVLIEDQLFVGDTVDIGGKTGVVEKIGLRTTCIRGFDGSLYIIPNSEIKIVNNMSKEFRRIVLEMNVEKTDSIESISKKIEGCLADFAKNREGIIQQPYIQGITKIADNSIIFKIICECGNEFYEQLDMALKIFIKEYSDANEIQLKAL